MDAAAGQPIESRVPMEETPIAIESPIVERPARASAWAPLLPLIPVFLAVCAYLPALRGGVTYDDSMIVQDCEFVQDLRNLPWLLSRDHYFGSAPEAKGGSHEQSYRPVGTLTHMLEAWAFALPGPPAPATPLEGPPPAPRPRFLEQGFRLTSVLLHALNALLAFAFAWRVCRLGALGATVVGGALALHPAATEAVLVASFREDLLALFFLLLGTLIWRTRAAQPGASGLAWSAAACGAYAAGMLAKEVGAIALPLAVAADLAFGRPGGWRRAPLPVAIRYGLLVATTAGYYVVRFHLMYCWAETDTPFPGGSRFTSLLTMIPVFATYARLFVWPATLPSGV